MQCPNCNHENKEGATFCEKCGAQLESEKKRMSFFERRQAKERERIYLMSKASLQAEDIENIADYDMGEVQAKPVGDIKTLQKKNIIFLILSVLGIVFSVVAIYLIGKFSFNDTLRVLLILVFFLLCAVCGGYTIDLSYKARMFKAMSKSSFAIKKLSYGKPPVMAIDGKCFELTLNSKCDIEGCGASMHIEEYNGEFIAVCDADRSHLRKLHCEVLRTKGSASEEDETKENIKDEDKASDIVESEDKIQEKDNEKGDKKE